MVYARFASTFRLVQPAQLKINLIAYEQCHLWHRNESPPSLSCGRQLEPSLSVGEEALRIVRLLDSLQPREIFTAVASVWVLVWRDVVHEEGVVAVESSVMHRHEGLIPEIFSLPLTSHTRDPPTHNWLV